MKTPFRSKASIQSGERFGRWLVVELTDRSTVLCRCDCGVERGVRRDNLVRGLTNSCGCINKEQAPERFRTANLKHGLGGTPIYACWKHMMRRCNNPNAEEYPGYGGRGISVHEPWHDAAVFTAGVQAEIGVLNPGMTLDRVDNDGDYRPGNVRWATRLGQARNRRDSWIARRADEGAAMATPAPRRRTKLSQEQVVEILAAIESGKSQTATAAGLGISQAHVSRIVRAARKAAAG